MFGMISFYMHLISGKLGCCFCLSGGRGGVVGLGGGGGDIGREGARSHC